MDRFQASDADMHMPICRMPWHDPELEVETGGYPRNMLSALLTTLLVHCKQQSLSSHEAKAEAQEAKLKPVSRSIRYTAKLKPIRKVSSLSGVSETL